MRLLIPMRLMTLEAIDAEEVEAEKADEANEVFMLSPSFLTKYSAFVAEAKGYFGKNNNQLGGSFGGNDIDSQLGTV
jgi:hypothetical protein